MASNAPFQAPSMDCVAPSADALGGTASLAALPESEVSSSATSMMASCVSTPATSVDTPLEKQEDDGVLTPRKHEPGAEDGAVEGLAQLQKLQAKLVELENQANNERSARMQLEERLHEEVFPIATAGFARSLCGSGYLTTAMRHEKNGIWRTYRKEFDLDRVDRERNSIGGSTALTITLLERELSHLKDDLTRMTELEKDRERMRDMEVLWERERQSLLENQHKLELLAREKNAGATVPADSTLPAVNIGSAPESVAKVEDSENLVGDDGPPPVEKADINLARWVDFRLCLLKGTADSYAIDVLDGEPDISFERPHHSTMWTRTSKGYVLKKKESPVLTKKTDRLEVPGQKPISERIRINSKHILKILSQIRGKPLTNDDRPLIMTRPYKALDCWSEAIRAKFLALESEFGPPEVRSAGNTTSVPGTATEAPESDPVSAVPAGEAAQQEASVTEESNDEWTHSLTAYQHLKCLIRFMDQQLVEKSAFLESDRCRTVAFTDIWYLFKPGDEVIDQSLRQAYRIVAISSPGHQVFPPWRAKWDKSIKQKEETPIFLSCAHIDFDGKTVGPLLRVVRIPRYDGEKTVTSLEVFPIRFADDKISSLAPKTGDKPKETLRQRLIERGKLFMSMTGYKHMRYNGVTLDTRDEVDSNVVVDFQEAFSHFQQQAQTDAKQETKMENVTPKLQTLIGTPLEHDFDEEDCTADCCRYGEEVIFKDAFAEKKRNQDYMESLMPEGRDEPPPSIYPRLLGELKVQESGLSDGDYLIMSYRVFGFVLRSRKWAQLDLSHISLPYSLSVHNTGTQATTAGDKKAGDTKGKKEVDHGNPEEPGGDQDMDEDTDSAFGQLVLPGGHKRMVKSLVAQHFRDKNSQEERQADIISGKGKGLIILLHGAPGVGKTTTAEGVAQMFEKPLYQITCGDLGSSATEVEKALETSFNLASRWGCVLLLDEADVFLAERSRTDFTRNGLVSVFLRVLEYYTGVLFLTTNRIGDFDEAFASRIHISLYYPQLNLSSTLSVFNLNLNMIQKNHGTNIHIDRDEILEFAEGYFDSQKEARWNGRQIRNACHTSLALAEFRAQGGSHKKIEKPGGVIHLKVDDLKTVSNAYLEFMKYLNEVHDKKGFEMWAKSANIRAREEEFTRKIAKIYEEMDRKKAAAEKQNQSQANNNGLAVAPGQSTSASVASPPAQPLAPQAPPQAGPGPIKPDATPNVPPTAPVAGPSAYPTPPEQPQPPPFAPPPGYPPAHPWAAYYGHPGTYAPPPQGNPTGPMPAAPQPYQPWQGPPYYGGPGGHGGPYPPQPPAGAAPS